LRLSSITSKPQSQPATDDASATPIVTGDVNLGALKDLIRLCTELGRLHQQAAGTGQDDGAPDPGGADPGAAAAAAGGADMARSRDALVHAWRRFPWIDPGLPAPVPARPVTRQGGHGQNAFLGTPAQGRGMLASRGRGTITMRVCFGYLAKAGRTGQMATPDRCRPRRSWRTSA
jgi:hypothetical protein